MRLCLFQPDIPQNLGASIRLAACFDTPLEVIEPCGFPLTDKAVGRAALDYDARANVTRHASWAAFLKSPARAEGRLVLFSTAAETSHLDFAFTPGDLLLFGRESAGVPDEVRAAADAAVVIPLAKGARSLNVATAAAIGLGEARRQVAIASPGSQAFAGDQT
ncbi:MAG: tRNA (cytidine(34)-2'-O)-methyltransferase [Maricaulaceae bacterium]|jgi:tRNA (cytidine/uridine-2'-O-)-methyltransferase